MVGLSATFDVEEPTHFGSAFTVKAVGPSSVELEGDCRVIPDGLGSYDDVFTGGTVSGNVCFVASPENAAGLVV